MKKLIAIIVPIFALTGCAKNPNSIEPIHSNKPCTSSDLVRFQELHAKQKKASRNDAIGVFMIGLPIASMTDNDHEEEIAKIMGACGIKKGQMVAKAQ